MADHEQYETLLYQHEVLRTRLQIREHYLGTVVKEVYENIGQMLSLIRIKLLGMPYNAGSDTKETIDSSGEMVGKTIRDLRSMCRLFYPEEDIMNGAGFHKVLRQEISTRFPNAVYEAGDKNIAPVLAGEKGLIVFGILLEIIDMISNEKAGLVSVIAKEDDNKLVFTIDYSGKAIIRDNRKGKAIPFDLSVVQRTRLLGGELQIKNRQLDRRRIILELPSTNHHEHSKNSIG